jgi:hypothetical protein
VDALMRTKVFAGDEVVMTPDQRALVLALVVVPGRPALGAEPVLTAFDAQDGEALGLTLLQDAVARRDPVSGSPDYLDFDEARALATKAVWALGSIEGAAALEALEALTEDRDPIVAGGARAQLERRDRRPSDGEAERRPVEPPAHESSGGTGPADV